MRYNKRFPDRPSVMAALLVLALLVQIPLLSVEAPHGWQDYRKNNDHRFKKVLRHSTRYIILHTTEAGLQSSLLTLSQGKRFKGSRFRTYGGHAHYLIDRTGRIYYLLDEKYRADHAGLSMWNGQADLSSHSLGIEMVAYLNSTITNEQYEALTFLLTILRLKYDITDKNVLTHAHVAYGHPNPWFRSEHRGRKRDAMNLDRSKLALKETWSFDPDVKAGRLAADPLLARILYSGIPAIAAEIKPETGEELPTPIKSNIIRLDNTAWTIAADEYDSPSTIYILPGGQRLSGDRIKKELGWQRLPTGTEVLLNQDPEEKIVSASHIHIIHGEATAWSFAGPAYRATSTFYFYPYGAILRGDKVTDWDQLPEGTRMLINYQDPKQVGSKRGSTPWSLVGARYNQLDIVYFIPPDQLRSGNEISDFSSFPNNTLLFIPKK